VRHPSDSVVQFWYNSLRIAQEPNKKWRERVEVGNAPHVEST
jgi:hypothetical protein